MACIYQAGVVDMKKSYYLKYGTELNKDEVRNKLAARLDLSFVEHESEFFGIYFSYNGVYADSLKIFDNFNENSKDWLDENMLNTIIKLSFSKGKNSEKLSRYKYVKEVIGGINGFSLIEDKVLEEM